MANLIALFIIVLLAASASSGVIVQQNPPSETSPIGSHVVMILMENHGINSTYGTSCEGNCSYISQLANSFGFAINYSDVAHKSLPNYLTLTSGANYSGPTTGNYFSADCSPASCFLNGTNNSLMDLIEASGRTWKGYIEDYVGGCKFTSASGGVPNATSPHGTYYDDNHNPFIYYGDIRTNATRCGMIVDGNPGSTGYLALPSALLADLNSGNAPSFMWLTPNECDSGHISCSPLSNTVSQQNQYLSRVVPLILNSATFLTTRSLLFVTWDEGTSSLCTNSPSQTYPICRDPVTTIWAGPGARTGYKSTRGYSHYSFVTTLETIWNLTPLLPIPGNIPAPTMVEFLDLTPEPAGGGGSRMYRI